MRKRLSIQAYLDGILAGDRVILAKAITLIESKLESDNILAQQLLENIIPYAGNSIRMGISGVPGVGKSTFIEAFGTWVLENHSHQLAILAIDPSSGISKGSILGDKTRMTQLATHPKAFIRPSASGGTLGGIAQKTRESILLCEAAGYDLILVESVGVGQSETAVKDVTDFFLLLMLAGAGDELQGIKRGIMEICDALYINKADGSNLNDARLAKQHYKNALHLFSSHESGWVPPVGLVSSIEKTGLEELYQTLQTFKIHQTLNGFFVNNRIKQQQRWLEQLIQEELLKPFLHFKNSDNWEVIKSAHQNGELSTRRALIASLTKMNKL